MARWLLVLLCTSLVTAVTLIAVPPQPAQAAEVQFEEIPVTYTFGGQVFFQVQIQSATPAQSAILFYRAEGVNETLNSVANLAADGLVSCTLDARQSQIPAFAMVSYWFDVTLNDGQTATSPIFTFAYEDNRFAWQTLESPPLHLHVYEDDAVFHQNLTDIAHQGLEKINTLIGMLPNQEIDLYVYESALDMQSTLRLANVTWIAGHADPWLGVVVVALPPGPSQMELARQRIAHELMHIVLYQKVGVGYTNLPAWLNEGLASMAELQNNPDYYTILQKAHEQELYLPLSGLCQSFPQDASNAFLAYAEAELFTRYLFEQVGAQKVQELTAAYADGMACERAPEVVLGKPLAQWEAAWQRSLFGGGVWAVNWSEILPWLALLAIALFAPLVLMAYRPTKGGRKS
jgi:hypothetical protein